MSDALLDRIAASLAHDELLGRIESETHEDHRIAPEFSSVGMKQSPCTAPWCKEYDEPHERRFMIAEDQHREGYSHTHDMPLDGHVHGMETHANADHIRNLAAHPEQAKGRALVFRHNGAYHVMDGHHRIAAGMLRGDSHHPVHLVEMGGEK